MRCKVLLDTSLAWVMARGPRHLAAALHAFFDEIRRGGCDVFYSEAILLDLRHEQSEVRDGILALVRTLARPAPVRIKVLLMRAGRYDKAVRRLGLADVLIALSSKEIGAVLATGDWGQARFYASIAGAKPPPVIYVPIKQLL